MYQNTVNCCNNSIDRFCKEFNWLVGDIDRRIVSLTGVVSLLLLSATESPLGRTFEYSIAAFSAVYCCVSRYRSSPDSEEQYLNLEQLDELPTHTAVADDNNPDDNNPDDNNPFQCTIK